MDETTVGRGTSITVRAEDRTGIRTIALEYLNDGEWLTFERRYFSATSVTSTFNLNTLANHTHITSGGNREITIRAVATNLGNVQSEEVIRVLDFRVEGPAAVQNLTSTPAATSILLRWEYDPCYYFAFFGVYRRDQFDGNFRRVATVRDTLGFNVTGLAMNTRYWFKVIAYDIFNNPGEGVEKMVSTAEDAIPPVVTSIRPSPGMFIYNIPVGITATDNVAVAYVRIEISQDNQNWTTAYNFTAAHPWSSVTFTRDIPITHLPEGAVFIRAFAVDTSGNESYASSVVEHRIHRTPPQAPTGLTLTENVNSIVLQWERSTEPYLQSYSVYRAIGTEEDPEIPGVFTRIASNITTLGFIDRTVSFSQTYHYQVRVTDRASNVSEPSAIVSGNLAPTTEPPRIHSINPISGTQVGVNPQIRVLAQDIGGLTSITAQYHSYEHDEWQTIGTIPASGDSFIAHFTWNNRDIPSGEVNLRFFATGRSGLVSDYFHATLYVVNTQPKAPELVATPGDWSVTLTWEATGEANIHAYQLFRVDNNTERLLRTFAPNHILTFTETNLRPNQYYSIFSIRAETICGAEAQTPKVFSKLFPYRYEKWVMS